MVIKIFIYGAIVTFPVFLIQWGFISFLGGLNLSSAITLAIYFLVGVALTEEMARYLVIKFRVLKDPEFDEPVDAMIYMIIAGLGFAAMENIAVVGNILFGSPLANPYLLEKTILVLGLRFVGATLLHALCSANIGFFLALSLFRAKKRWYLLPLGLLISIILHGFYNLAITMEGWPTLFIIAVILISLFFIVLAEFKKVKKLTNTYKTGGWPNKKHK